MKVLLKFTEISVHTLHWYGYVPYSRYRKVQGTAVRIRCTAAVDTWNLRTEYIPGTTTNSYHHAAVPEYLAVPVVT